MRSRWRYGGLWPCSSGLTAFRWVLASSVERCPLTFKSFPYLDIVTGFPRTTTTRRLTSTISTSCTDLSTVACRTTHSSNKSRTYSLVAVTSTPALPRPSHLPSRQTDFYTVQSGGRTSRTPFGSSSNFPCFHQRTLPRTLLSSDPLRHRRSSRPVLPLDRQTRSGWTRRSRRTHPSARRSRPKKAS